MLIGLVFCISLASAVFVTKLTDENRDEVLTGEWFIKAYAPWCGACKSMAPAWTRLGDWAQDKEYNIAEIDITVGHNFANELLVTRIPTLFHVKNGVWTSYSGARHLETWKQFLMENQSEDLEPMAWYRKPGSVTMKCFSYLMAFAMKVQEMHDRLTTQYNVPMPLSVVVLIMLPLVLAITIILLFIFCLHYVWGKPKPIEEIGRQRARKRTLSTQPAGEVREEPVGEPAVVDGDTKKDQ